MRITKNLAFAATLLSAAVSAQAEDLSAGIYNVEVSAEVLNNVQAAFPERDPINPAYISYNTDPNLSFTGEGEVSVTFYSEGAGYKNTFGYFTYDLDESGNPTNVVEQTIFANASAQGSGGSLLTGDTVDLGTFDVGDNVGFFVTANGFNGGTNTFYSIDSMNMDGLRHIAMVADTDNELIYLGFEDIKGGGDLDYNDVVFSVTANPFASIDITNIPSGSPEAPQLAGAALALSLLGMRTLARRRRSQHQRLSA